MSYHDHLRSRGFRWRNYRHNFQVPDCPAMGGAPSLILPNLWLGGTNSMSYLRGYGQFRGDWPIQGQFNDCFRPCLHRRRLNLWLVSMSYNVLHVPRWLSYALVIPRHKPKGSLSFCFSWCNGRTERCVDRRGARRPNNSEMSSESRWNQIFAVFSHFAPRGIRWPDAANQPPSATLLLQTGFNWFSICSSALLPHKAQLQDRMFLTTLSFSPRTTLHAPLAEHKFGHFCVVLSFGVFLSVLVLLASLNLASSRTYYNVADQVTISCHIARRNRHQPCIIFGYFWAFRRPLRLCMPLQVWCCVCALLILVVQAEKRCQPTALTRSMYLMQNFDDLCVFIAPRLFLPDLLCVWFQWHRWTESLIAVVVSSQGSTVHAFAFDWRILAVHLFVTFVFSELFGNIKHVETKGRETWNHTPFGLGQHMFNVSSEWIEHNFISEHWKPSGFQMMQHISRNPWMLLIAIHPSRCAVARARGPWATHSPRSALLGEMCNLLYVKNC